MIRVFSHNKETHTRCKALNKVLFYMFVLNFIMFVSIDLFIMNVWLRNTFFSMINTFPSYMRCFYYSNFNIYCFSSIRQLLIILILNCWLQYFIVDYTLIFYKKWVAKRLISYEILKCKCSFSWFCKWFYVNKRQGEKALIEWKSYTPYIIVFIGHAK